MVFQKIEKLKNNLILKIRSLLIHSIFYVFFKKKFKLLFLFFLFFETEVLLITLIKLNVFGYSLNNIADLIQKKLKSMEKLTPKIFYKVTYYFIYLFIWILKIFLKIIKMSSMLIIWRRYYKLCVIIQKLSKISLKEFKQLVKI